MMIEIVKDNVEKNIIKMRDMKPLQIGRLIVGGHIVMRTASTRKFEVMDLTVPGLDSCWTNDDTDNNVELFAPDTTIILKINNN